MNSYPPENPKNPKTLKPYNPKIPSPKRHGESDAPKEAQHRTVERVQKRHEHHSGARADHGFEHAHASDAGGYRGVEEDLEGHLRVGRGVARK